MIVFEDEVFFRQEPTLHQTWARIDCQPEIPTLGQRNTKKFFGAVSLYDVRFTYYRADVFNSSTYIPFLEHLIDTNPEHKLFLIHDNAKYHKSQATNRWLSDHSKYIEAYLLPPYSPKYNAIEYVWRHVRLNHTHNRYFATEKELISTVVGAFVGIQKRHQQIYGYLNPFL